MMEKDSTTSQLDFLLLEELSDEAAAAILGGRFKDPRFFLIEVSRLKAQGGYSEEDLYPGLGMQADNETPLT